MIKSRVRRQIRYYANELVNRDMDLARDQNICIHRSGNANCNTFFFAHSLGDIKELIFWYRNVNDLFMVVRTRC